jgi:DNA polymerase-3 subunit beta
MAGLIKARAGSLAAALGLAALPVSERQSRSVPMLGAVHLAAAGGDGLSITASTFEATVTIALEAKAEGEVRLPLERLGALARHFPADAELAITADDHAATIAAGRSRFKLPVFPIADLLPRHAFGEETGRVELDAKIARDLFARPAFAASTDESRHYLAGIFLHSDADHLAAVAADGHRLCLITAPATAVLSTDQSLIIPNPMVKTIDRLLGSASGNVTLRRSERLFSVEGAGFKVVSTRVDATYPDFARMIPAENPNVVTTSRARLRESLARFAAVADPQAKTPAVCLRWNAEGLHLSAPDGSTDLLAADVEGEAEIGVRRRYVDDLVAALRGDSIRLSSDGSPGSMILITDPDDENFTAVQMPMRLP